MVRMWMVKLCRSLEMALLCRSLEMALLCRSLGMELLCRSLGMARMTCKLGGCKFRRMGILSLSQILILGEACLNSSLCVRQE